MTAKIESQQLEINFSSCTTPICAEAAPTTTTASARSVSGCEFDGGSIPPSTRAGSFPPTNSLQNSQISKNCTHPRLSLGLDRAHCPDCKLEFHPWQKEYKGVLEQGSSTGEASPVDTPPQPQKEFQEQQQWSTGDRVTILSEPPQHLYEIVKVQGDGHATIQSLDQHTSTNRRRVTLWKLRPSCAIAVPVTSAPNAPTGLEREPELRVQHQLQITKTRTLSLDDLIRGAYRLDRDDLKQLSSAIKGLLEALEPESGLRVQDGAESPKTRTLKDKSGSFELKKINNCGPYLYLRWWSGGKHRSTYIGKEKRNGRD